MSLIVKDRVRETTSTAGTGTVSLAGPVSGFQSFSSIGNGNTTYYTIADSATGDWEVGIGTYTASGSTLSRDTVLSSSNGGALVAFGSGPKDVFVTYPAEKSVSASPGTSGNVLTSNGVEWISAAPTGGGITYLVKTANYTALDKQGILANTTAGPFTVTLPATPTTGMQVVVADSAGTWGTNSLTVGRNGSTIEGAAADLVCSTAGVAVQFIYNGTTWDVFSQVAGNGSAVATLTTTQTLTNKTISADSNTLSGIAASSFVLSNASGNIDGAAAQKAIPAGVVVGTTDTQTLTNKTISADSNTLSGIAASSFVLSNASGNIDGAAAQKAIPAGVVVGTTDTQTLTNKTLSNPIVTLNSSQGTAGQVPVSQGAGLPPVWGTAGESTPVGAFQYFAGLYSSGPFQNRYNSTILPASVSAVIYGNGLFVASGQNGGLQTSVDGITWITRTSVFGLTAINALAYGNGLYVSAGGDGTLATSTDAITWTARTSGTASTINALTYGNGLYVYAGAGGVLATSTDAITWTARTSGTASTINAITYAGGLYIYAGIGGVLRTSTDAITWTARTSGTVSAINALKFGSGVYVYAGDGGVLRTSTDAVTWTARTSGTASNVRALAYDGSVYVYAGAGGVLATSTDAITWTSRTSGTINQINATGHANNLLVYGDAVGQITISPTNTYPGVTWLPANGEVVSQSAYPALYRQVGLRPSDLSVWTARSSGTVTSIYGLVYGSGIYVYATLFGGGIFTSTDAVTWTARTTGTASTTLSLVYGNNLYAVSGGGGIIFTSTDAITWTSRTSGTAGTIQKIAYQNNLYVYGADSGVLATSTDAITWTARTSGTASTINALTYGNGLHVYAGAGGVLATSTDAITWTARTSGTTTTINVLAYANGLYVYGGARGVLATSTDAVTWTARTSGTTNTIRAIIYANGLYVYGANGGVLATSTDAITWTSRNSGTTSNIFTLLYANDLYLYAGNTGALAVSSAFNYNTATEFALPAMANSPTRFANDQLYIKATA